MVARGDGQPGHGQGDGDERLVFAHAWLGSVDPRARARADRLATATPLPPWDERLTELDRRVERLAELVLYWLLVLTPSTGLALLFLSGKEREVADGEWFPPYDVIEDDVLLVLHVACHIALYVTLLTHVGIALRRRTLSRIF